MTDLITTRFPLAGPRWWDIEGQLNRGALQCDLEISVVRTTSFLRQNLIVKISGERKDCLRFLQAIKAWVRNQNADD
jgi:hypothetical protein